MEERIVDREARMFFVVRREVDRLIVSFFSGFERVWFSLFGLILIFVHVLRTEKVLLSRKKILIQILKGHRQKCPLSNNSTIPERIVSHKWVTHSSDAITII